jgi:hypothetical protein
MEITYTKFIAMVLVTVLSLLVFYGSLPLVFYPTEETEFLYTDRYIEMFTGRKPLNGSTITITGDAEGEPPPPPAAAVERVRVCIRGDMVRWFTLALIFIALCLMRINIDFPRV